MRLFLSLPLLFLFGCASALPEKRPKQFKIEYSEGGGMRNVSWGLEITAEKCTYGRNYEGIKNGFDFSLSNEDLDAIYQVFRENKFDRIRRASGEIIHDKGGPSIWLRLGKKSYGMSTSGSVIALTWRTEWRNIVTTMRTLKKKQIELKQKPFTARFSENLIGKKIGIYIHEQQVIYDKVSAKRLNKKVQLLPGNYRLTSQYFKKDEEGLSYQQRNKNIVFQEFLFDSRKSATITVGKQGQGLSFRH